MKELDDSSRNHDQVDLVFTEKGFEAQQPRGHGLIIEPPSETDYVSGDGNLSGEVINPDGNWLPFIPKFEHQAPRFETNSCATQATLNAYETLSIFLLGEEKNLSDRMVAKGSGTDPKAGNSPQKVSYFFYKNWSVFEEDYPMEGVQTVDEYYKEIPDILYSKAQIVRGDGVWGYEAITNPTKLKLQDALTKGAVCISVAAWGQDENGIYYKPATWRDNHYVQLLQIKPNGNYLVFDSYDPSLKEYRGDAIPAIAYRYTLNEEQVDYITRAIAWIKEQLAKLVPVTLPKPVPKNYSEQIYQAAYKAIGKDNTPFDQVPDEVACVHHMSTILRGALKTFPIMDSTKVLFGYLEKSPAWEPLEAPEVGAIIVNVTDTGNGVVAHGHCGIVGKIKSEDGSPWVMSNDSDTGLWSVNYTVNSWKEHYQKKGGMKTFFYRGV